MFMTLLFYVLPIIARKICQSFRCTSYDMGDEDPLSLLIADVSIDCQTDEYWAMFFFACLMVLVYPIGTPMCLLFMLFKHRKRLNPPMPDDLNEVELHLHMKKVAEDRREDEVLKADPISVFAFMYKPWFWGFEVYDMAKRLMLTCGVVVLCRTLAQTILYVLFVACVTLVVEREAQAYLNDFISAFAYSCGWQVRPSTRCGAQ
mmetsp:Transcript_107668/g.313232  ORF Transcript_107668/g.313232 Transcript_107668/m.313232 type:complete len:204 (-) Transcript_107668:896-1507(-)